MAPLMGLSRDVYANLLREGRGLRREQSRARDAWYAGLGWERKEAALFELEMLLKGFACFGNPRNQAGPPRQTPALAHDFREETRIVRDGLAQATARIRELLGERDRAYQFSRYLETVLPEDGHRSELVQDQLSQDSPEESLFVLRNTFASFIELADGMLRLERVPHRQHQALLNTICREIGRNEYFNPLKALEFRPELDRLRTPEVLEALHASSDAAHRTVALTFLSLFRGLRYVALVDQYASNPEQAHLGHLILAVFRSDMRALARFLRQAAGDQMADAFERALLSTGADELGSRFERLSHQAGALVSLRRTLDNLGNVLDVEIRKTAELQIAAPSDDVEDPGASMVLGAATLRATLQHATTQLCLEIQPAATPPVLASPNQSRLEQSERLRRDVWMFKQVLRAFLAKAEAAPEQPEVDCWEATASLRFVKEFLEHFRAIGFQLVRLSDYARLDRFMSAIEGLRDVDLLERGKLAAAARECHSFYEYLDGLFGEISKRRELQKRPFDKRAAAETLRVYLGAA